MILWFLFLLAFPTILNGELNWQSEVSSPFSIAIKIDEEKITRDAFVHFEALFTFPFSYELDVETLVDRLTWNANPLAPELSIEKADVSPLVVKDGVKTQRLFVVMAPLMIGQVQFSLLEVSFYSKEKNQPPVQILTPPFTIEVEAPPPQPEGVELSVAPLAPLEFQFPMDLTLANRELLIDGSARLALEMKRNRELLDRHTFPWMSLMIFLGIGGLGWTSYLIREWLPKPRSKPVIPPDPREQANQALNALKQSGLLERSQFADYYAVLTGIALSGLEAIVGKPTTGLTTKELEHILKEAPEMPVLQKEVLLTFLREADQIKFSGKKVTVESVQKAHSIVQDFIRTWYQKKEQVGSK